ncbi:phospholipid-binding protein MlaC [Pendulispora albinea]|uniref:ABC transporter substrate-binding protein n=1 Tax=Pendulispora albinea TaxID=2741071 RepID=A0ABZ2LTW4_9BACT
MKLRNFFRSIAFATVVAGLAVTSVSTISSPAFADEAADAQAFVQAQHAKISALLRQPASGSRDTQINSALETFVDYDELTRRAFGKPCPPALSGCTDHWGELNDSQKAEVRGLLKQLVEKNYRKNIIKTLDYEIAYKSAKAAALGDSKIRTEAQNKLKPRDPAVQVDYFVHLQGGSLKVVDIVTEGSSLTKNYYDQFHKMFVTAGQGYPYIVKKLNEKIAKKD